MSCIDDPDELADGICNVEVKDNDYERLYKEFIELEEEGRSRAIEPDEKVTSKDELFLNELSNATNKMGEIFFTFEKVKQKNLPYLGLADEGDETPYGLYSKFMSILDNGIQSARTLVWKCQMDNKTRGECLPGEYQLENLDRIDRVYRDLVEAKGDKEGVPKRCTHLYGLIEPYRFTALLNDVTACFHRGLEEFGEITQKWEKSGKCSWIKSSNPKLVKACQTWDTITTDLHNQEYSMPHQLEHVGPNRPYSGGDYLPLKCIVMDNQAELTVGSSSGHRVHVNLRSGTLDYYDNDEKPNEVVRDLLNETDADCEIMENGEGVTCKNVSEKNVVPVFKVLAMPTSMDFRLGGCKSKIEDLCRERCWLEKEDADSEDETDEFDFADCMKWCKTDFDCWDCRELEKQFFHEGPANFAGEWKVIGTLGKPCSSNLDCKEGQVCVSKTSTQYRCAVPNKNNTALTINHLKDEYVRAMGSNNNADIRVPVKLVTRFNKEIKMAENRKDEGDYLEAFKNIERAKDIVTEIQNLEPDDWSEMTDEELE